MGNQAYTVHYRRQAYLETIGLGDSRGQDLLETIGY